MAQKKRTDYTTISIPRPLHERVQKMIQGTGFTSASSFVSFILRELLLEKGDGHLLAEETKIRERLKKLGYL
ncbi:MAG: ribbon-helix-helix domain-containing protein [Patescibacteria group bacterium]|nr:ribbon-helix-helix domain-containing protein [Patescibacteria group bacterium]